jgi:hypothetical protein
MIRRVLPGLLIGLVMLLAACSGDDPTPEGDAPLLVRIDSMPKVLATVVLSETPTALLSGGVEQAVAAALDAGLRTADIAGPGGTPVSTSEMTDAILARLSA